MSRSARRPPTGPVMGSAEVVLTMSSPQQLAQICCRVAQLSRLDSDTAIDHSTGGPNDRRTIGAYGADQAPGLEPEDRERRFSAPSALDELVRTLQRANGFSAATTASPPEPSPAGAPGRPSPAHS